MTDYVEEMRKSRVLPPERIYGRIIVEWPSLAFSIRHNAPIAGCLLSIFNAETEEQITSVVQITLHAHASGLLWAELTMFTDEESSPLWSAADVGNTEMLGTFPFVVTGMRIRPVGIASVPPVPV